jgi:hypothetical protein
MTKPTFQYDARFFFDDTYPSGLSLHVSMCQAHPWLALIRGFKTWL